MGEKETYFQVPKSLFRLWRENGISTTAYSVYILMLDRYKLSKKNKWFDEEGNTYINYSYDELLEELRIKNKNVLSDALKELEDLKFLKRKKRHKKSTSFYLKNESNLNVTSPSNVNVTSKSLKNSQKSIEIKKENEGQEIPNKNNISKNNYKSKNNNVMDHVARNEIYLLLKGRDIKINQITKICVDIQRIKEVIAYANIKNCGNGFILKALKENWKLGLESQASYKSGLESQADFKNGLGLESQANYKNPESQEEKDYSMSIDEALKRSRGNK